MINLLWSGFIFMLVLSGCGFDGAPSRSANDFIPLTSIEITAVSSTIAAKTSTKLSVTGNFSGLFTRDITDQAVWLSSDTTTAEFVTLTSPSRVTGHKSGTAILTATVGSVSATFNLTVSNATIKSIAITPVNPSISQGLTIQFAASGAFSDGTTQTIQDLTFDAAWTPTPGMFATVSNDPASKGLATALAEGVETITATFDNVSGTTQLTVTVPVLQSITVTTANTSVLSLSTASFQAIGHFSDGTTPDITSRVAWSSSNTAVATIAADGAATTLSQGNATITATLNNVPGTTNLKVTGGTLTGFTVSPATVSLVKGTVARMTATGTFSNGTTITTRDITGAVTWSPANTDLATVTKPGGNLAWLNALAVTQSTIVTAKAGTLPDTPDHTTNLNVTSPTLSSIALSPASFNGLIAGTSTRFIATATFSGGLTQVVTASSTWNSSNVLKATVGDSGTAKGRVTGVAAGTTTITATHLRVDGVTNITSPSVTVSVTAPILQSLTIPVAATVNSGNQVKFTATAVFSGSISQDVTEDTVWSIDKPNIAILADSTNLPGEVVGVDSGTATLTAKFGGKTQTMTLTVP